MFLLPDISKQSWLPFIRLLKECLPAVRAVYPQTRFGSIVSECVCVCVSNLGRYASSCMEQLATIALLPVFGLAA
jgi:hypothetical protein